jgi:hypothetical protein
MSESLEKGRGPSISNSSSPVDDEVLNKPAFIVTVCLERQHNTRIIPNVADFPAFREVPGDDLVAIQADPDDGYLWAAIGFQRDEMRER